MILEKFDTWKKMHDFAKDQYPLKSMFQLVFNNAATPYSKNTSSASFNMSDMLAFGMGRLFRQTHEICLIGTNNNNIYKKYKHSSC